MSIQHRRARRVISQSAILIAASVFIASMMGCAMSLEPGEELQSSDEMLEGPGIFSGEDGAFNIITLKKDGTYQRKEKSMPEDGASSDLAKQDLQGTSDILDEKILELEKQQEELEALKREVKKKIEAN